MCSPFWLVCKFVLNCPFHPRAALPPSFLALTSFTPLNDCPSRRRLARQALAYLPFSLFHRLCRALPSSPVEHNLYTKSTPDTLELRMSFGNRTSAYLPLLSLGSFPPFHSSFPLSPRPSRPLIGTFPNAPPWFP